MAYCTNYYLSAKAPNLTPDLLHKIDLHLRDMGVIRYVFMSGMFIDDCMYWDSSCETRWDCHDDDMLEVSTAFPDVTFQLHGVGEAIHDEWDKYYRNGEMEACYVEVRMPEPTRIIW